MKDKNEVDSLIETVCRIGAITLAFVWFGWKFGVIVLLIILGL